MSLTASTAPSWIQWDLARRVVWQWLLLPPPQPPLLPTQARPGSGTTERHLRGCATLASPGPRPPSFWAGQGLFCSEPLGAGLGRPDGTVRGRVGQPSPLQCQARLAVQPTSCQCHRPQGATSPAACPLVPVAAMWCRRPPPGWVGGPSHSHLHSPGVPLRFLNVILKSEK